MTAPIFLAAFLGCLFAFAFTVFAAYTYARRRLRRAIAGGVRPLLEGLVSTFPAALPEIVLFVRERAGAACSHGEREVVSVRMATATCNVCGANEGVPDHPLAIEMLHAGGWTVINDALVCAACSEKYAGTPTDIRQWHKENAAKGTDHAA